MPIAVPLFTAISNIKQISLINKNYYDNLYPIFVKFQTTIFDVCNSGNSFSSPLITLLPDRGIFCKVLTEMCKIRRTSSPVR